MTKFVREFFVSESGASAAEYALILAVVGAGIALAALALGRSVSTAMTNAKGYIDGAVPASTGG